MNAHPRPRLAMVALLVGSATILSGCAMLGGGRGSGDTDTAYVARDVESLYSAAKSRLGPRGFAAGSGPV